MDTVTLVIAALLAVLVIVAALREVMWRGVTGTLRAKLAARNVTMHEQEQFAHVGQLVSKVAQELKSPLQGVIGNTELMLASDDLTPGSARGLHQIHDDAVRAAAIVRNLLAFTESSMLNRRWQDLNELVTKAVGGMRTELEASGVGVRLALADRLPLVYVDGRQFEKVIATLLSRPAPRSEVPRDVAEVTVATRRDADDRLVIEVDDCTAGDLDEPEWSADLAACREVVLAHGGSLEVVHPEHGCFRFHLELPVTAVGAGTAFPERSDPAWTTSSISST